MSAKSAETVVSQSFLMRRVHSLMGLGIVLFLMEHLLTNSRAALWIGDDGKGFIQMVNLIHSLPYVQVIEMSLIGIPIIVHAVWGIKYALTARPNSLPGSTNQPRLGGYARNHAYTWQRLTSWFLLVAIVFHVYEMRFAHYPVSVHSHDGTQYMVMLEWDDGLYTVGERLGIDFYDSERIEQVREQVDSMQLPDTELGEVRTGVLNPQVASDAILSDRKQRVEAWANALGSFSLDDQHVVAQSSSFGTIILMNLRDAMKSPLLASGYTIFVLAACFHAFNGLWTFLITWGLPITPRSQRIAWMLCVLLMLSWAFLGIAAAWGTYFFNLRV